MRILIVHDYATATGGAEIMNEVLVEGLRRRGHEVRRFTSTAGLDQLEPASPEYTCRGTTGRWRTILQSANLWAPTALRRALRQFAPDILHVRIYQTQLSPLILPVLRKVPSLYHEVWYRAACPTGNKLLPDGRSCTQPAGRACLSAGCLPLRDWIPLMAQRHLDRRWRNVFRAAVANSRATAEVLEREWTAPVTVVPNGVPVVEPRERLSSDPTAAFVGRLVREKGIHILIRAFARVSASNAVATLDVVGDGPERVPLEMLAAQLGVARRVRFHGHQPRARCEEIVRTAWVQVVPSLWAEPFGLVAVEAMMRGTAVVASASGGLSDIVRDTHTGVLVAPGDVDALAGALDRVLGNEALARQWGAAGRTVALVEYTSERFIDRILAVYSRILEHADRLS